MKNTTIEIKESLENEEVENIISNIASKHSATNYQETNANEILSKFLKAKEAILVNIELGSFDDISYNKRIKFKANLDSIKRHFNNINQVILDCDQLYDLTMDTGLFILQPDQKNYEDAIKQLAKLKRQYRSLIKTFEESGELFKKIKKQADEIDDLRIDIERNQEKAELEKIEINKNLTYSEKVLDDINGINDDIEGKRLSISTFHTNIEEYKENIKELKISANYVLSKKSTINELIKSAEQALHLKSAEGLNAALTTQYSESSKWYKFGLWIILGIIFFILAIAMTIWIVSGYGIKDPNSWNSIIGRIVAIGVAISAAAFSAKQYSKQKNIIEDYAYKLTLAKSIVAFKEEIEETDDVKSYLTKVLDEIHKDPLRSRSKIKESNFESKHIEYLEKAIDLVKNKIQ